MKKATAAAPRYEDHPGMLNYAEALKAYTAENEPEAVEAAKAAYAGRTKDELANVAAHLYHAWKDFYGDDAADDARMMVTMTAVDALYAAA